MKAALRRRALGFETDEVVEEYSVSDGEPVLVKRKVTRRDIPPDIKAVKMLLDGRRDEDDLSDEELAAERQRLVDMLAGNNFLKEEKS